MSLLQLAQNLIRIPSYVDKNTDEQKIGEFIYAYLRANTPLEVNKQAIGPGRFNVIATDGYAPKLLFCCHMDTVEPKEGCRYDQFRGLVRGRRLYGLGAYDMKGGIAAVMEAARFIPQTRGLTLLFYCDEEYRFAGMKKFIEDYCGNKPKLAVFPEPTDLKILNGCRGVIEIRFRVRGKSGHVSQPENGIDAIGAMIFALSKVRKCSGQYRNKEMGFSLYNLSFIKGRVWRAETKTGELMVGDEANNISDTAKAVISVRPTSRALSAERVIRIFRGAIVETRAKIDRIEIQNNYAPFLIPRGKVGVFEGAVKSVLGKSQYGDISKSGYFDAQLLNEKLSITAVIFGAKGGGAHAPNEWVDIASLEKASSVYKALIRILCL